MAKELKFKDSSDLGFDSGLEIPEFSFGKEKLSKDRHPVITNGKDFGSGMVTGIWSAATSESFIKKVLKQALPEGYGTAIDLSDMTGQNLRKLYDSSAREIKPLLNDMKRATNRLLPASDKVLPTGLQAKLKAWAESYEGNTTGLSADQIREQGMNATLGEVFSYQLKTDAQNRVQDQARANIKEQIDAGRAAMQLGALNDIKISLQRLVDYQDKITVNYQRRSLELQYRQYFVALDALAHQRETSHQTRMLLEGIQKNTGLPEIRKIQGMGDYTDLIRNKFFNSMGSMLFGNRSAFMQSITENIQKALVDNIKDFAGTARMGVAGFESAADMGEMMEGLGESKPKMAGDLVGGAVAGSVGARLGRSANNWFKKQPRTNAINRSARWLHSNLSNLPQKATEFAHSDKGDNLPGPLGYGVQFIKDVIHRSNATHTGLQKDDMRSLQEPAIFNGMARKSLTEIIPGYLARIYRELQVIRTGDTKTDLTVFDPNSGRFKSAGATASSLHSMLFRKNDVSYNQDRQKDMVAELEKVTGQRMNPELKRDAITHLMQLNMSNRMGDPNKLSDVNEYIGNTHVKNPHALAGYFQQYFGKNPNNERKDKFQELMNSLTHGMTDNRGQVQGLLNLGYGDMLDQMGILTKQGNFNLDRFGEHYLGKEFNAQGQYVEGGAGTMGLHAHHPATMSPTSAASAPIKMTSAQRAERVKQERKAKKRLNAYQEQRDVSPMASLLPEVDHHSTLPHDLHLASQDAIIHAIAANSSKKPAQDMLEELKAIRKHMDDGLSMHHFHSRLGMNLEQMYDQMGSVGHRVSGQAKSVWDRSIKDTLKAGWGAGTGAAGWVLGRPAAMARGVGKLWDKTKRTRSALGAGVMDAGRKALEFSSKWDDVYLPGESDPVLLGSKLRKGLYINAEGEVLKSWKDIKSAIRDTSMGNQVALPAERIADAYVSSKLGRKTLKALGSVWSFGWDNLKRMKAGVFSAIPVMWDAAKKGVSMLGELIDQPIDIYVKGEEGVKLLARSMRAGHYRSMANIEKVIKRPGDIDGPVIDMSGSKPEVALSKEDLAKGLVDVNGKPIRTPLQKLGDLALGPLRWLKNTAKSGFNFTLALLKKPIQAIGQFFTNWFGPDGIVFSGSKTIVDRLTEIRDMLDQRLAKPKRIRKGSWEDLESHKGKGTTAAGVKSTQVAKGYLGKAGELAKDAAGSLFNKLFGIKDPNNKSAFQQGKDYVEGKLGGWAAAKAGDKVSSGLGGLKDRILGHLGRKLGGQTEHDGALHEAGELGKEEAQSLKSRSFFGRAADALRQGHERGQGVLTSMRGKGWLGKAKGIGSGLLGGALSMFGGKNYDGPNPDIYAAVRQGVSDGLDAGKGGVGGLKGGLHDYLAGKVQDKIEDKIKGKLWDRIKGSMMKRLGGRALAASAEGLAGAAEGASAAAGGGGMMAGLAAELGLSGVGGALAGAAGTAATGLGSAALGVGSTALGLGAGALTLVGGIAATLGGAAVTLLASPVVLGAAALAIGAYGLHHAYKGIKHLWKERKMGVLTNVRMAQYGFKSTDKDHVDTLLDFEETMLKHVTYDASGKPQLDHKKLTFDEALEPFGVKRTDQHALRNWFVWFAQRFRPVFLTHVAALRAINKQVELPEVDSKLKKEEKAKYLKATEFPSGPYRIGAMPFARSGFLFIHWGAKHLECGPKEVREAIEIARKKVGVDDGKDKKKDDKKNKTGLAAAAGVAGAAAGAMGKKNDEPKTFLGKAVSVVGKALFATSALGLAKKAYDSISKFFGDQDLKGLSTMQKIGVFLSPTLHGLLTRSKLHPFEGLRFKAYGLEDYDADKIAALKNIESHIGTRIKLSGQGDKAKAEFVGDPMDVLMHFGGAFDPTNVSEKGNSNASKWLEWFTRRFLPVFLTYQGSFLKIAGDRSLLSTPDDNQAAILAPLIAAAKGQDGVSVWNIKASPWPGYALNNDAGSVKPILDLLKEKAKAKKLTDGVDKNKKPADAGKGWTDLLADKAGKKWDEVKSWMGKKYDQAKDALSGAWTATKSAVGNAASAAWSGVKNSAIGKTVTGVAQGVGDSMQGFGATLGKAYKATVGNAKMVKDAALAAMKAAGITNPVETAMFMAQMDTESGGFKSLSENLSYSAATLMKLFGKKLSGGMAQAQQIASQGAQAVANFIYGNRMGNSAPDDGFKYRGRGIIQLTGKDNYAKYGKMLGLDLVGNPDLAADPKIAAQIAVAYWKTRVPQAAAQAGDVKAVTHAINGGENGLGSRQQNFQKYMQEAKAGQLVPSGTSSDEKKQQSQQAQGNSGTGVGASTPSKNASVLASTLPTGGPNDTVAKATAPAGGAPATSSMGAPTKVASSPAAQSVVDSAAPAPAASWGAPPSAAPSSDASPYGFSQASMKSTAPQTRGILAVQQAQHEEKMSVMAGHADIAQKQLDVQTETRDLIKQVLQVVQDKQKSNQSGPDTTAGGGVAASRQPNSSLRGTVQPMPRAPVSMTNSV